MKSAWCSLVAVGIVFVLLAGCGGGGTNQGGADEMVGTLQGGVDLGGNDPADYEVFVDSQKTGVQIQPDGTFVIPGVPIGEHVVDIISHNGMEAGRAVADVRPGPPVVIPEPIQLEGAGQIVGFVVKRDNGQEEPLEGVEVVARSDLPWILTDNSGGEGTTPAQTDTPLIYPPPPGVQYSAFTEVDGSYCMKGVLPGPYFVTVAVPGLTPGEAYVWVEANRTAVADFVLEPVIQPGVGTVAGTVSGESSAGSITPLVGARVTVEFYTYWRPLPPPGPVPILGTIPGSNPPDSDTPPDTVWRVFRTLTDQNGHYSLNVPSGHAEMSVWVPQYLPEWRMITVEPNKTTVEDFVLQPVGDIIPLPAAPE